MGQCDEPPKSALVSVEVMQVIVVRESRPTGVQHGHGATERTATVVYTLDGKWLAEHDPSQGKGRP